MDTKQYETCKGAGALWARVLAFARGFRIFAGATLTRDHPDRPGFVEIVCPRCDGTERKATVAKEIAAGRCHLMQALVNALVRAEKAEVALGQIADIACNALRPVATSADAPHQLHDG